MALTTSPTPAGSDVDTQPDFELVESETPESGLKTPTEDEQDVVNAEPEVSAEDSETEEVVEEGAEETAEGSEDSKPVIQTVFRHDCVYGEHGCPARWSKFAHLQEEQDQLEAEIARILIVHRRNYTEDKEWVTHSFTINDLHMRDLLAEALENYFSDSDALDLQNWTFKPSYEPIVHRWDKLQALHKEIKDTSDDMDKIKAVDGLIAFIQPLVKPGIESLAQIRESGRVAWDDLWQVFPPGELAVTKIFDVETVVRVASSERAGYPEVFQIEAEYIEWNGSSCRIKKTWINIDNYDGSHRIRSLKLVPLSFTENPDEIRETMQEVPRAQGIPLPRLRRPQHRRGGARYETRQRASHHRRARVYKSKNFVPMDEGAAVDGDEEQQADQDAAEERKTSDLEAECLITSPWLIGFDIKAKKWARFCINSLADIEWNDKAFDNLVSRGGEKHLAWEFVESKAQSKQDVDDFVHDKGRGIIILMFGPPRLAERARVPLYVVSAGVLSTKPAELESGLDRALDLCRMWNAMLLLDEADVFLSERSDEGLERNELVSIFLTKLEYYQGILFLTTNRFSSIDHAFQSRVDLFLPYYDLDGPSRKQVWHNFFVHFGQDKFRGITEREMDRLCELSLNGREIKNLCKSALLLSKKNSANDKDGRIMAEKLYMLAERRVAALRLLGHGSDERMVGRH
ncbi:hypothetical protein QBC44DRAFT_353165 [Cladorrhinum sp. PSN332]|nr:hypothetical protein QBC44DRAFT_353165 [Cladorrhinum sp. PSN332]